MERKKKFLPALILFLAFSVLNISLVGAGDELYLTGILKSVSVQADKISGTIVVDVKSQSCPGLRTFSLDDAVRLKGLEGKKFSFGINSSSCKGNTVYKIISPIIRNGG